jgi:hypothetical protein
MLKRTSVTVINDLFVFVHRRFLSGFLYFNVSTSFSTIRLFCIACAITYFVNNEH